MKQAIRSVLFWTHLVAGVVAGLLIALMGVTGLMLAFEHELVSWAEKPSRVIEAPAAGAPRLGLDELLDKVRTARPGVEPATLVLYPDPAAAVRVSVGREGGVHVDPYRGTVRELAGQNTRDFTSFMTRWHRWLGMEGPGRDVGKAIKSAATLAFIFMALSGLYLWWPRKWTRAALRATTWFRGGLSGKARDFNWHNTFGFWFLPAILVVAISGIVISYRWASDLVYTLAGEKPPAGPAANPPPPRVAERPAGTKRLGLDVLYATAAEAAPRWTTATIRLRNPREEAEPGARAARRPGAGAGASAGAAAGAGARALVLSIKQADAWPRTATLQLWLDPFTGEQLRREPFAAQTPGRQARVWLRYLHTGEALGWPGQIAAALTALASVLLVYTGFALALRRLARRLAAGRAAAAAAAPAPAAELSQ